MSRMSCHDCGGFLVEAKSFRKLPRVTSDCRPWPAGGRIGSCRSCGLVQTWASPGWRKECVRIYSTYRIYRQSGGKEQAVFRGGAGEPRSARIVRGLGAAYGIASRGNLLDVGCGNGGFLRAFHARHPRWRLCGTEFDRRNEMVLKKIPSFARLYCGKHTPPPGQFDLISLVHVLEHLENPSGYLAGLRQLARPGAKIVIEVPDAEANPFILPVADHVSHFDRRSLRTVVEKAGLKVEFLRNDLVPRELTLVAKLALRKGVVPRKRPLVPPWLRRNLSELGAFARLARREARRASLTVFGSSLGAAWIYGVTRGRVKEFLDEDTDRQGRRFLGRPIRLPAWGCGRVILVPLALKVRSVVTGKLGSLGWKPAGRVKK